MPGKEKENREGRASWEKEDIQSSKRDPTKQSREAFLSQRQRAPPAMPPARNSCNMFEGNKQAM